MKKIYIVDNEMPILEPVALWFENEGFAVKTFVTSTDFIASLVSEKPDLILMDIALDKEDGRQLCSLVKVKYRNRLPIILISASADLGATFGEYDADAFIEKPFDLTDLTNLVDLYLK